MRISQKPIKPLSETMQYTAQEWRKFNPFLSDEEVQERVKNPPKRNPNPPAIVESDFQL